MKYFLKLNGVSAIYGFFGFLFIKLQNSNEQPQGLIGLSAIILLIALFVISPWLTKKWLECRLWALLSTVLWFPYFVLYIVLTGFLFTNNNIDDDNFGAGLIMMFFLLFYPFYLLITSFLGTRLSNKLH